MIAIGLAVAAAFALVFGVALWCHERALATAGEPKPSVVAFELAGTGRATHGVVADLGPRGRLVMRAAIGIDRWIIVGYAGGLAVLSLLSLWVIDETSAGAIETVATAIAIAMAVAALLAGALDVHENSKLLAVLDAWSEPSIPDGMPSLDAAAIRQAHRRTLISTFEPPSVAARRSALLKFGLLGLIGLWGLTIGCIAVAYYAS